MTFTVRGLETVHEGQDQNNASSKLPTAGSVLSFEPHLSYFWFHKLSIWPPCGTVWIGGMHSDSSLIAFQRNAFCSFWLKLVCICRHQWTCDITNFAGFVQALLVFRSAAILKLAGKTWWPLFRLLCGKLFVIFRLAEAAWVIDNLEPPMTKQTSLLWHSQVPGPRLPESPAFPSILESDVCCPEITVYALYTGGLPCGAQDLCLVVFPPRHR